jgi:hypothetical protein
MNIGPAKAISSAEHLADIEYGAQRQLGATSSLGIKRPCNFSTITTSIKSACIFHFSKVKNYNGSLGSVHRLFESALQF